MESDLQTKIFIENQISLIKDKESLDNIQMNCWRHILKEFNHLATLEKMVCLSMKLYTEIILQSKKQ